MRPQLTPATVPTGLTPLMRKSSKTVAATDGTVVFVLDELPDQLPGALPESISLLEADGNSVIVDIGGGLFMA